MKLRIIAIFLICMSAAASSWADTLDFGLSDTSARAELAGTLSQKQLGYSLGGLHNSDDGDLLWVGLHVDDRLKASTGALSTSIGGKLVGFDSHGFNGSALALGGYLRKNFSAANLFSVRGDLFYAPRVVTWGDADHYLELGLRLEYQLVEQAAVYVGFRDIKLSVEGGGDRTLDNSAQVGLILYF